MIVRIPSKGPFSWKRWATAWVNGGIPAASPRVPHPLTHSGVCYRTAGDEPTYQGGPLHLFNRFDYFEIPPVRNLIHPAGSPQVGDPKPVWVRPAGGRRHQAGWWLTWGAGWPDLVATRSLFERWWYRPVPPPVRVDPNKVLDRRAEWYHRDQEDWRWWRFEARRLQRHYQGRWWTAGTYAPGWDYAQRRWQWFHTRGVTPLGRTGVVSPSELVSLDRTNRALRRRARFVRSQNYGAYRVARYRRYLFERIPRRRRRGRSWRRWRRWCRVRRERLQAYQAEPTTLEGYYQRVTRSLFRRWVARPARLEQVTAARPLGSYLTAMSTWVSTVIVPRVGNPLEYNFYKPSWGATRFLDRKGYKARRWRLRDHPRYRVPFQEARAHRWGWFQSGGLQGERAILAAAETREIPIYNPEVPPLEEGPYAAVYWSLQPWGRGSRWRTRPTERARYVWIQTVKGGYSQEHDAVQWSHACTAPTGVNYSHLGEIEFPRVATPDQYVRPWRWEPPPERAPVPEVSFRYRLARWITPVWWIYWVVATGWALLLEGILAFVIWILALGGAAPFLMMMYILREVWSTFKEWAARAIWAAPTFQTVRWTYTAWVLAYNAEDETTDMVVPRWEEEDNDNYADDDDDPSGEQMLPEAAGATDLLREEPNSPWEWWWYKDLDEFYEEGLEMAQEILTEDLPYGVRLIFGPWVDFWFRLPLWGVLDMMAALVVATKLDYQRWWWRTLSRGNTPTQVMGRWWKIPLVLVVNTLQLVGALWVGITFAGALDSSTITVWVVYSCGLPWHDEYYWGWVAGWLFFAVRLMGPRGWRTYLDGLGWSNLVYLFVGSSSLVYPEDYYPHRSATVVRSAINNRTLGNYFKIIYAPEESDRPSAGVLSYAQVDSARVTPAAVIGYNETPWELDIDDGGYRFQTIPHLVDREELTPEYPKFIGGRWGHDMALRHPSRKRNNFYDVDYVTDLGAAGYTWPSYYMNARNRHTRHEANLGETSIHHD